jgi:ornithine cyclodeaminase/alanine dehydrogenase-like protein (mu-crystallin family)
MIVVTEQQVADFADYPALIAAMESVFIACAAEAVDNYPFIRSYLRDTHNLFGVKSGCNYKSGDLGLKSGGYWPDNARRNLDAHQSTVLLIDAATGQPRALVAGNTLTALRTAAAAAVAARWLARRDASHVALLGAGRQALFQLKALCEVRPIRSVSIWSRSGARAAAFGEDVRKFGLSCAVARTPREAVREADIVVTLTPSKVPLIALSDVLAGVHINAMGSDTQGKRELSSDLLDAGLIWADDVKQASLIGECQYVSGTAKVSAIGELLAHRGGYARGDNDITIFDGTGLALQDLAAANYIVSAVVERDCAQVISL